MLQLIDDIVGQPVPDQIRNPEKKRLGLPMNVIFTIGATGVTAVSWMTRTKRAQRRKKILFDRFLGEIDKVYTSFKLNSRSCETELHKLNNSVLDEFKQGTLDEEQYNTLNQRIEDYMKEVQKQIEEENK